MSDPHIYLKVMERYAEIRWRRSGYANAFTSELLVDLSQMFEHLASEYPKKPVIMVGDGGFSAGADGRELIASPTHYRHGIGEGYLKAGESIRRHPAPVISAVEKFALGGGLVLALSCDFVVAGKNAALAFSEAEVGLIGGLGVVTELVGRIVASRMVILGSSLSASEAAEMGLVSQIVPDGCALDGATSLASRMGDLNPGVIARAKALLRSGISGAELRAAEADANHTLLLSNEQTIRSLRERIGGDNGL